MCSASYAFCNTTHICSPILAAHRVIMNHSLEYDEKIIFTHSPDLAKGLRQLPENLVLTITPALIGTSKIVIEVSKDFDTKKAFLLDVLSIFYSPNLHGFAFCHLVQVTLQQRISSQTLALADMLHLIHGGRKRKRTITTVYVQTNSHYYFPIYTHTLFIF